LPAEIILALDVDNFAKAKGLVKKLYPAVRIFKIGSQIFTANGPKVVEYVLRQGGEIFLDLKYHDIPNTVASAVKEAVHLKVKMLTLHISGGREMLEAAVNAVNSESKKLKIKKPLLIGVTVLTSQEAAPGEVLRLARLGVDSGLDGVVCSVKEAAMLRKEIKKKFVVVTPGIRPLNAALADQKRVATAQDAIKSGSDYLVIGRPILEAKDPVRVTKEILSEIKSSA